MGGTRHLSKLGCVLESQQESLETNKNIPSVCGIRRELWGLWWTAKQSGYQGSASRE